MEKEFGVEEADRIGGWGFLIGSGGGLSGVLSGCGSPLWTS